MPNDNSSEGSGKVSGSYWARCSRQPYLCLHPGAAEMRIPEKVFGSLLLQGIMSPVQ
jgi:hypothetical protein